ncbi:MAG: 4-(cytidine 5'-diphospho)-2-C-methyl-D-erythritol kinase [Candidatus Krumholzibacteriota bacterium]|nr:4-(cytidine 5'-diphospho)-2-C-methyl-D-erythritol kinase [Candidatus Krumholzibacteriota bacterium]
MSSDGVCSVLASAKINLYLEVLGRRNDGFHDILTFFQPVSLYDRLRFIKGEDRIILKGDDESIPWDESNLCWKAARAIFNKAGYKGGVKIEVRKSIPSGAGLGGGSSDAAAVLSGLNEIFQFGFGHQELHRIAYGLGSDVPFFLGGGAAVGRGRGEILEAREGLAGGWIIIVKPPVSVSTRWAYENIKILLTRKDGEDRLNHLLEGLREFPDAVRDTVNSFEDPVVSKYPEIGSILKLLKDEGAVLSALSGSGAACFGLFSDESRVREVECLLLGKGYFAKITQPVEKTLRLLGEE